MTGSGLMTDIIEIATPEDEDDSELPQIKLTDEHGEHSRVLDLALPFFYNVSQPSLGGLSINRLICLLAFGHKFFAQRIIDAASAKILVKL